MADEVDALFATVCSARVVAWGCRNPMIRNPFQHSVRGLHRVPRFHRGVAQFACLALFAGVLVFASARPVPAPNRAMLLNPDAPQWQQHAPDQFRVQFETTKGPIVIEIHRDWSPNGVDHFYNLARFGYYDDIRFFRVEKAWAQFGINGDPAISAVWRNRTIPDDPRRVSNTLGTIAYAFAVPNGRATEVFINLRDNSVTHDPGNFVPFGKIIEGLNAALALNSEYGERAGSGIRAGHQDLLFEQGNAYLDQNFPRLDKLIRATVLSDRADSEPS